MTHDRAITISTAGSSKALSWLPERTTWAEFTQRLRTPVRGTETYEQYIRMTKPEQDKRKDVGGYVGGTLKGEHRRKADVTGRDLITLDMDALPGDGVNLVAAKLDALGCAWAIYSTRRHQPGKPRLRVILPLADTISGEEYEPVARKLAEHIGLLWCDPTTFQAERMMYWPSASLDAEYVFQSQDRPLLEGKKILASYDDWRDVRSWPVVPGTTDTPRISNTKKPDPKEKAGPIGAFCREYSIHAAIENFLPGVYAPVDGDPSRYTFTGGSTTGGAVVYDDGRYLCSHHATDPVGDRGVNAFDLVRVHLFGQEDARTAPDSPVTRMPSYHKMIEMAMSIPAIRNAVYREQEEQTRVDFGQPAPVAQNTEEASWFALLERDRAGRIIGSGINALVFLEHDPALADKIYLNAFSEQIRGRAPLPWSPRNEGAAEFAWSDRDFSSLSIYLAVRSGNGINADRIVNHALNGHLGKHQINPVRDYVKSKVWDGVQRLETLLIDYLGAEDTPYTRAVTSIMFVAAVARVMTDDSVKFDTMCVLTGNQGIGKSTLIRKMAILELYTDGVTDFEGKNAAEIIQGKIFVEIPEMHAMLRADINRVKSFLSQQADDYRPAYGRTVEHRPRRCVFWGTSNDYEYLSDPTGGRRFFPVDTLVQPPTKSIWQDLDDEKQQVWSEAYVRWLLGYPIILEGKEAQEANKQQMLHTTQNAREGVILDFLEELVPEDWPHMDLAQRKMWRATKGSSPVHPDGAPVALMQKERICAQEVFQECLGGDLRNIRNTETRDINRIIRSTGKWKDGAPGLKYGYCGTGRGFVRAN